MAEKQLNLDRPFTRRQLMESVHPVCLLRRREFRQILPGVWVRSAGINKDTAILAALAVHPPGAFVSHLSAAAVHGLPVPDHAFVHVTVTKAEDRRYRPQVKPHVTIRPRRRVHVRGIPVTDVVMTFIQCAGMLSLVDLVILGDAIVKRFDLTAGQLLKACQRSTDYYAGLAAAAAAYVRDGVDSPMETRLRMLIVLGGLPEPEVNVRIYNADGTWRRRFDLCYRRIKLIIEFDGRQHAESIEQWESDLERREEFDDGGYRILVVTAKGIFRDPARTLHRIRRQLALRGWGDVPELDDLWREYFAA